MPLPIVSNVENANNILNPSDSTPGVTWPRSEHISKPLDKLNLQGEV